MKQTEISRATLGRIPVYLDYLKSIKNVGGNISATAIAKELGLGEVQVRKDLNSVSGAGRPKTGYGVKELTKALETYLNAESGGKVVIVGAGKLGRALLDYGGFGDYGLDIAAAFDIAVDGNGHSNSGKPIYPMDMLENFCRDNDVSIGVIAVPAGSAQEVCDRLVKNGIRGVWCFAPCTLNVPPEIPVQYENMALSLAYLNKKI